MYIFLIHLDVGIFVTVWFVAVNCHLAPLHSMDRLLLGYIVLWCASTQFVPQAVRLDPGRSSNARI